MGYHCSQKPVDLHHRQCCDSSDMFDRFVELYSREQAHQTLDPARFGFRT